MKIISYSDLHLEFGNKFLPPPDSSADIMILAGDIITFRDFRPLSNFIANWHKPLLFIAGNHEYYTKRAMESCDKDFKEYISANHPNLIFLQDSEFVLNDVHFFGGTMWTDFNKKNVLAMIKAQQEMNDYKLIHAAIGRKLLPYFTVDLHYLFKQKLEAWLEKTQGKKRVIISHHAPVLNPNSNFKGSGLEPAFNSLDMVEIIEKYQPELWVYGHTHECDDQMIGKTRIISNQYGYIRRTGAECARFDEKGLLTDLS